MKIAYGVGVMALVCATSLIAGCGGFSILREPAYGRMPPSRFGDLDAAAAGPRKLIETMAGGRASVAKEPDGRDCPVHAEPMPDFVLSVPEGAGRLRFYALGAPAAKVIVIGPDGTLRCSPATKNLAAPEVVFENAAAGRYKLWAGMPGHLVLKPVQLFVERSAAK